MSVVSYFHQSKQVNRKFIHPRLALVGYLILLLNTLTGIHGCKNVDKVSDSLIFKYNEDQTIATLDPAFVSNQSEIWIINQLFNRLIELDSALMPTPSLAKSWETEDSARVYKFHLRSDAYFHQSPNVKNVKSKRLTAADVAYSFKRLVDPKQASPAAWIFNDKISSNPDSWSYHFEATHDSLFTLRLNRPVPSMLKLLGTPFCSVVSAEAAQKLTSSFGRSPVGTGPFYLKLWVNDVRMVLRKHSQYFEKDQLGVSLPYLEAINIFMLKNKQTAFMKFVAGELDFFNGLEGSFKDELLTKDGNLSQQFRDKFHMLQMPFLNTEFLGIYLDTQNNENLAKPLRNPKVRQALSMAIDKNALIRYLRNGMGVPGNQGFVPPTLISPYQVKGYEYNPNKASQWLKEAGYAEGKGIPQITLTTTSDYLDMMVFVQRAWQSIGIQSNIDVQPGGMLRQKRNKGQLTVYRGSWIADYADAENYLAVFYSPHFSPNGPNYTHFKHPEFDLRYEELLKETREEKRRGKAALLDSMAIQWAPVIILYYDKSLRLYHKNVVGLSNDAGNRLLLKRVKKK